MENIINITTFIQHLTYYLKVGIYINKGTDKDTILETCIKMYNKYKTIETSEGINEDDETSVRKCLKRLNLIFKVEQNGAPVDIRKKENQLKMLYLNEHPSLSNDKMDEMIEYATKHNINIFTEIPLMFILRESKYQELLWQYTRSLFYISQLLISKVDLESDPTDKTVIIKQKIFDDAAEHLELILVNISEIDEKTKSNQMMSVDSFLSKRLIKTGVTEKNVNEARQEVKDIFIKKGLGTDNSMSRMIDSISNKLTSIDLSKGNIIQNMLGIAQNVFQEMKGDLENDPAKFQSTLGTLTEVFQEALANDKDGQKVPPELKNMFNSILASGPGGISNLSNMSNMSGTPGSINGENSNEEINKGLEGIIEANGLNRDEFFNSIKNNNGEIDVTMLEKILQNLNKTD